MRQTLTTGEIFERLQKRGRTIPQDPNAEAQVIAGMIAHGHFRDEAIQQIGLVDVADSPFVSDSYTTVYRAICRLVEQGEPVDLTSVARELKTFTPLRADDIQGVLRNAVLEAGLSEHALAHLKAILRDAKLRKVILGCERAIALACDPEFGEDFARDEIEQLLYEVHEEKSQGYVHIGPLVDKVMEQLSKPRLKLRGVLSGIEGLDKLTNGWQNGDLIVIAAKSSDGKTSLALHCAIQSAYEGYAVAFSSAEMTDVAITRRLVANHARINSFDLKRNNLSEEEFASAREHSKTARVLKIYIDSQAAISPLEIKGRLRKLMRRQPVGLVVIDYFQLLTTHGKHSTREQELATISRSAKAIALDLNLPVILLAQVNKDAARQGRRIHLSDLRECEALRMDADLGIVIVWDEEEEERRGIVANGVLDLQKHREGPRGEVRVTFDKSTSRFEDEPMNFTGYVAAPDRRYEPERDDAEPPQDETLPF